MQANLALLLDPYVLLGMLALLPMLEAVDTLIQWAQKQDAFICDFVGALGTCQSSLFTFYLNDDTAFRKDEFHAFNQVVQCSHEQILMKWEANLNLPYESLCFVVGGETLYALHDGKMVHREGYAGIISSVQNDCKGEFTDLFTVFACNGEFLIIVFNLDFSCLRNCLLACVNNGPMMSVSATLELQQ